MEIPTMKFHVDNAIQKFYEMWEGLLLEESRDLPHLQNCQEAIHDITKQLRVLSLALQEEIQREL